LAGIGCGTDVCKCQEPIIIFFACRSVYPLLGRRAGQHLLSRRPAYLRTERRMTFTITCQNVMDRRRPTVREAVLAMPGGASVLCTASLDLGLMDEREIEDAYGVQALTTLEELLRRVERTGALRGEFIGRFDMTPFYNVAFIYAVNADGDLLWFKQRPSSQPNGLAGWDGPQKVGDGWGDFLAILPAGGNNFYAALSDGTLRWYQHTGFNHGTEQWNGPTNVGSGWNTFKAIVAGSDGVLYAVQPDGTLLWYRHDGFRDGGGIETWRGPVAVGSGWDRFTAVFSAGNGILYAVAGDGALWWYRHKGFADGAAIWDGGVQVGVGWQDFSTILSVGDGVIYAVKPDGTLLWYKHEAWNTDGLVPPPQGPTAAGSPLVTGLGQGPTAAGTPPVAADLLGSSSIGALTTWREPVVAGTGWNGYRHLFPLLPATPLPPR